MFMPAPSDKPIIDSLHILDTVHSFPDQCAVTLQEIAQEPIPDQCYLASNIVISGMGGSALGGRVIASLERQVLRVPIITSTEYHLPNFVDDKTLVIISSYSGNTEETISSLSEARARNSQIFILTAGGKLAQIAKDQHLPHYIFNTKFNPSSQPRMGVGYSVIALAALLSRCRLIQPLNHLNQLPEYLKQKQNETEKYQNLAETLKGKIPVLVSSEHLKGAVHCIKNQINENAKNFCVLFDLPELNHHLMEGLSFPKSNPQNLHFVLIKSEHFHPEVKRRYPITEQVLKKQGISFSSLSLNGPDRLFEAVEAIQAGGYLSFYLSQANGIDPGPIPWVDYFKDVMAELTK
jgi:glucose/mannose-6-phosphate isomerase